MENARIPRIGRTTFIILNVLLRLSTHEAIVKAYRPANPFSCSRRSFKVDLSRDSVSSSPPSQQTEATRDDDRHATSTECHSGLFPVSLLIPFSLLIAIVIVAWEDYSASNLWPSRHMVVTTTSFIRQTPSSITYAGFGDKTIHGLGFGKRERLQMLEQQDTALSSSLLPDIRAYNEVMEEHRVTRVARWRATTEPKQQMERAVEDLRQALLEILNLQNLAKKYKWDEIHSIIQYSLIPKLEPAADVLRRQVIHDSNSPSNVNNFYVAYEEIGFDWGSCAWRHCGALADAQEALDELDHLLGVLEPAECLLCLNIAERSIRDMLAAVPVAYHALEGIPTYVQYHSVHAARGEFGEKNDVLDQEYWQTLNELRNTIDEVDD